MFLSAGGNDVGLSKILNDCVFGWAPKDPSACAAQMKISQTQIDDELPGWLDNLLKAAKAKLTPKTGRIYYTAYAQFFNEETTQCDKVSWDFWNGFLPNSQEPLTSVRRKNFNTLTRKVNDAIKAAVDRAALGNDQVVYVDYDPYFGLWTGRYCEAGVTETDADREALLFFERDTPSTVYNWKAKRAEATTDPEDIVPDGTFEGDIAKAIRAGLAENPSLKANLSGGSLQTLEIGKPPADGSAPEVLSVIFDSKNSALQGTSRRLGIIGIAGDALGYLIPDTTKRVFHPRPVGHAIIASLLLWHMEIEEIKMFKLAPPDVLAVAGTSPLTTFDTCPLQEPATSLKLPKVPGDFACTLIAYTAKDGTTAYTCEGRRLPEGAIAQRRSLDPFLQRRLSPFSCSRTQRRCVG